MSCEYTYLGKVYNRIDYLKIKEKETSDVISLYTRGLELVRGSEYLDRVKANVFYKTEAAKLPKNKREVYYEQEALATAIGDKGAQFVTEARRKSFAEWARQLWDSVAKAAGFKNITAEEIQNLTFDEFTKRAAADILKGGEIINEKIETPKPKKSDTVSITHAAMDLLAEEFGLSEKYEKDPTTVAAWDEAAEKGIAEGKMADLIRKMQAELNKEKSSWLPSAVEQRMMLKYIAGLKAQYDKTPTKEIEAEFSKVKKLSDIVGGRLVAQSLRARQGDEKIVHPLQGGMLSVIEYMKETNSTNELTDAQRDMAAKMVEEYKAAAEKERTEKEALQKKYDEYVAQQFIDARNAENKSSKKKTYGESLKERKKALDDARDALSKLPPTGNQPKFSVTGGATPNNSYTKRPVGDAELKTIAPHVTTAFKSLVDAGATELSAIVKDLHTDFESLLDGLTERNIQEILAGKYNEQKATRNDLAKKRYELLQENKLLLELERVKNSQPKKESAKQKKNERIAALQEQIKNADAESSLKRTIASNETAIKKLQERIDKKDFEPQKAIRLEENYEFRRKHPDLWAKAMNAIVAKDEVRHKFEIAMHKDQMAKMGWGGKGVHLLKKAAKTIQGIVAGADDSFLFVQAGATALINPKLGYHTYKEHWKDAFNETRFNRNLAMLKNIDHMNGDVMANSDLAILEPTSLVESKKEEQFAPSFLDDTFKVNGKEVSVGKFTTKPFERAYTSLGNNLRAGLFNMMRQQLEAKGITFENNPKVYKDMALVINNLTGRGSFYKGKFEQFATSPITTTFMWSPRLLAASMNLLGITDIATLGQNGFYSKLSPEARRFAFSQMGKGVGLGLLIMGAIHAASLLQDDDTPEDEKLGVDPDLRSSTFGTIKIGDHRVNVFGRYASVAKNIVQVSWGQKKTQSGIQDLDAGGRQSRGTVLGSFARGKMTPLMGTAWDVMQRKEFFTGKPISWGYVGENIGVPMSLREVPTQMERDGLGSLLRFPLTFSGINISDQRDFPARNPNQKKAKSEKKAKQPKPNQ